MNMLIGMVPPTSGTAYINGFDITTELDEARNSIGICPQHDILFNDLTVREHIIFFCKLKGMKSGKEIDEEVDKYLDMLGLRAKKNSRSKNLSGGQKRRLSIANALCGRSTFVILDEVKNISFLKKIFFFLIILKFFLNLFKIHIFYYTANEWFGRKSSPKTMGFAY